MKPILFNIGPVNIYAYGLFVAAGFFFAVFLARKSAFKFDIDPDIITNLGLISLIAGIAGARIGYVLTHFSEFSQNLPDIIKI